MPIAVLDLEGVLVDTRPARRAALLRALTDAGIPAAGTAPGEAYDVELGAVLGDPRPLVDAAFARARARRPDDAAVHAALDETAAELTALRAERYFGELVDAGALLVPGARAAVERLAVRLRLGVVTRLRRTEAARLLDLAGLEHAFSVVVTAEDARRVPPAPDAHRRALGRLARAAPHDAARPTPPPLAFEGTAAGVAAARAAGARVVGVGPDADRGEVRPDVWVPAVTELTYDSLIVMLLLAPERDR